MSIIDDFTGIEKNIVIDHCSKETIGKMLKQGFQAGVTLSPIKTSFQEICDIAKKYDTSRIMCNTDSGSSFHEDLFNFSQSNRLLSEVIEQLTFKNAFDFFL